VGAGGPRHDTLRRHIRRDARAGVGGVASGRRAASSLLVHDAHRPCVGGASRLQHGELWHPVEAARHALSLLRAAAPDDRPRAESSPTVSVPR
jgi:hypothetical protein